VARPKTFGERLLPCFVHRPIVTRSPGRCKPLFAWINPRQDR
jgi:hypothetical protein